MPRPDITATFNQATARAMITLSDAGVPAELYEDANGIARIRVTAGMLHWSVIMEGWIFRYYPPEGA